MAEAAELSKEISAKLRGYDGLSAARLGECPAILAALNATDPPAALTLFKEILGQLPDDKFSAALKCALRLDPTLPGNLTGRSGRRMVFALTHSVSEETVKTWEARAIETLAQMLAAKPIERLTDIEAIFWIASGRICYKWTATFYEQGDKYSTRLDSQELYIRRRQPTMPFAAYQLGTDEQPTSLAVNVIFQKDELPDGTFGYGGIDLFGFTTGNYEPQVTKGPHPGVSLLQELRLDVDDALRDSSYYQMRWFGPEPLKIYGIAWY
jgi:hypothetical protein